MIRIQRPFVAASFALAAGICFPQEPPPQNVTDGSATFGVTVVDSSGLQGQIYLLSKESSWLPNFKHLKPAGAIYTTRLNIPQREFTQGFPGVTDRFEWFAIDYTGKFWIENPGKYQFGLLSDDGSRLYIDNTTLIDNDGIHPPLTMVETVKLARGIHTIRVSYFQGPRAMLALILSVAYPGEEKFRIFDTRDFRPPAGRIAEIEKKAK